MNVYCDGWIAIFNSLQPERGLPQIQSFVYPSIWSAPLSSFDEEGGMITHSPTWLLKSPQVKDDEDGVSVPLTLTDSTRAFSARKVTREALNKMLSAAGYEVEG